MAAERLELVAMDVATALQAETAVRLRKVAAAVCREVVHATGVTDERVAEGLRALGAGRFGDTLARLGVRKVLEALDETYLDMQERYEAGQLRHGDDEPIEAFARARAVHALWFALDSNPLTAACEAVYEVYCGLGDYGFVNVQKIMAAALMHDEPC